MPSEMRRIGVSAMALFLAGCATAPADMSFTSVSASASDVSVSERTALLVVAIGGAGASGTYMFQRVEAEPAQFAGPPVHLPFGGISSTMMARPSGSPSSFWIVQDEINFLVAEVEPGLYAANYAGWGVYSPVTSGTAWHCQTSGAPTFELSPGQIAIVLTRDAFPPNTPTRLPNRYSEQDVLDRFEQVRAAYPQITGEPVLIPPTLETRWTEQPPNVWVGEPCTQAVDGSVSIYPAAGRTALDDTPSDAERAARDAAIRLLQSQSGQAATDGAAEAREEAPK